MNVKTLVLNCGSSSVKYKLYDFDRGSGAEPAETVLASGLVEEVGLGRPRLTHRRPGAELLIVADLKAGNHRDAIALVLDTLVRGSDRVLDTIRELGAVGHRVVHGGERFAASVLITGSVIRALYDNIPLAPLHNPPNIQGIEAMAELVPDVPQVAVFDTAFHQSMEPQAYLYALPFRLYRQYGIRRYGFHGTSHRYVAQRAAEYLGRRLTDLKVITCHLGNGASVTAIQRGRSVMTSMGFTPLEGLVMGTRCGDLDPAIVPFLMDQEALTTEGVNELLNKESGVLGLTEKSSDMRALEKVLHAGPDHPDFERYALVLRLYTDRIKGYIGAYAALLGGVDCLVFTGGVGENFPEVCDWSCQNLEFLGIEAVRAQRAAGRIREATSSNSQTKVLIVPTDEELAIAKDTFDIVFGQQS